MTPKEKAEELVDKFDLPSGLMSIERKQCALIAVDEILNNFGLTSDGKHFCNYSTLEYYEQVKKEIEKLCKNYSL